MPAPTPDVIPQPFADGGSKNSIPDTTADTQRASFALGFPPRTMQPIDAGGAPMLGPDMNGILYACTQWLYALQGGQIQPYRATVSTAVGGYALGALVLMADGAGYWLNTTNGNTANPDTGGAGWQPVYAYGATSISGLTGGDRTLSAVEAARYFLVLSGALVANQQIIVPNAYRNYLIVNACTGAFTLTVKTAAGTGVAIPAGGAASPTAVWCDTVNVNPVFVPSALPTSVTPVANTIPLRDNTGRAFELTAPVGTRTTQVATTEFANPGGSLAPSGWRENPDGTIEQWGIRSTSSNAGVISVAFSVPYPNACTSFQFCMAYPIGGLGDSHEAELTGNPTLTGASLRLTADNNRAGTMFWRALGY